MYLETLKSGCDLRRNQCTGLSRNNERGKSWDIPRLVNHPNEEKARATLHVQFNSVPSTAIFSRIPRTNEVTISDGGVK
jgi:hypothetical protein